MQAAEGSITPRGYWGLFIPWSEGGPCGRPSGGSAQREHSTAMHLREAAMPAQLNFGREMCLL